MMQEYVPWTEDELVREISTLKRLIEQPPEPGNPSAVCARSFLKQVLKDKRAALAAVRYLKARDEQPSAKPWQTLFYNERELH